MAKVTRNKNELNDYFKENNIVPDYKDTLILKRFLTERGKILPASRSGVSAKNQRRLAAAIKRARFMALLPYTSNHAI